MLENIILGIIQGVTEWLPISSKSAIILIKNNIFNSPDGLSKILKFALFLHIGTFLAAIIYLRKDVANLLKSCFNYGSADNENKKILRFLIISTLISGLMGLGLFKVLLDLESVSPITGKTLLLILS